MALIDVHRPINANGPVAGNRFNEHPLKNEHQTSRFFPVRAPRCNHPTPPSSFSGHWNGHVVSEVSVSEVSSAQSHLSAESHPIYHARQDPIGTPRRCGRSYLPSHSNGQQEAPRRVRYKAPPPPHRPVSPIPLWEEPILFSALYAFERPYTRELVSDDDEILIPRRPPPNAVWAHNPRQPVRADAAVWRRDTHTLEKKRGQRTSTQNTHTFRRHPFPIGGPNPFRHPARQSTRTEENPVRHPATPPRPPAVHCQSMINPYIIRGLKRLVEEDDEEIILYLNSHPAAEQIAAAVAEEEWRMTQEVRPRKHRPAVLNQRAYDQFLAERRLLSPPLTRHHLDEEHVPQPQPEVGEFDDFPVCEMSIAMGLHDRPRRAN